MADIRLGQALALKHFLADYDMRESLAAFCKAQYAYHTAKCIEHMVGQKQDIQAARKFAHFAVVYDGLLAELQQFADTQVRTASQ